MVKVLNASYRYNASNGVQNVSFEVRPGEMVILVGKTGAGKTTLFRLISLEIFPESGDIMLERFRSRDLKRRELPLWRRRLGIVFQDFRLLPDRSVIDNVRLAASCDDSVPGRPRARALKALARVGLAHKLHSLPGQLSTGELQRASIARALVNEPFLLLADEPVSNLDSDTAASIVELLQQVNKAGTAMLIATHQPERFEECHPRVLRMEGGRLSDL